MKQLGFKLGAFTEGVPTGKVAITNEQIRSEKNGSSGLELGLGSLLQKK